MNVLREQITSHEVGHSGGETIEILTRCDVVDKERSNQHFGGLKDSSYLIKGYFFIGKINVKAIASSRNMDMSREKFG